MRQLISFLLIAATILSGCQANKKPANEEVSFYKVPLECGAAPEIGCGSRIKPLFVATEKESSIKESWTNRQGTVLAFVWSEPGADNQQKIEDLFAKNDIEAERITSTSTLKELRASFRDKGRWYKGMDVDQLSIEEAGVIAADATSFALEKGFIDSIEATILQKDIEDYFKSELVKVRTLANLNSDSTQERWRTDAYNIAVRRVGKERADKITHAYEQKLAETENCD